MSQQNDSALPPVQWHDTLPSTMVAARTLWRAGAHAGTTVAARAQSAGRGRSGRLWLSPRDGGLWCTTLVPLPPDKPAPELALIAGLAARSICQHVMAPGHAQVGVKWPNDLWLAGRKLAGVLIERVAEPPAPAWALVGLGLNLATPVLEDAVPQPVGLMSCSLTPQTPQDAHGLARHLVALWQRQLMEDAAAWASFGLGPRLAEFDACHVLHNRDVFASGAPKGRIFGRVLGVDESGALRLAGPDGVMLLTSGEVWRVRPGEP